MEDLEFDKHLKKAIIAEERKTHKQYLKSLETSLGTVKKYKKINWRIAASILLVIGLGSYLLLFNQSITNDKLYDTYFSPYENVIEPIVRDQIKLTKKAEVFSLYERGEYQEAIDGFNKLKAKDSVNISTINFYKANAYLQLNEIKKAQKILYKIVKNKEWKEESLWYLALIAIKLNDIDTALAYLQKLQKENKQVFKSKEIKEIINMLD